MITTTACVAGGGPAGMMLGLLLARAGVDVVVLEKHADFLRDFRGDTVHPSTIEVLDELGLAERFHALPHHKAYTLGFDQGDERIDVVDLRRGRLRFPYIAFVPQWDFLDLLASEAERYPNFRLLRSTEATGLVREGGRVVGVQCDGRTVRAALTIAADGRHSTLRGAAGLRPKEFGAPMDVLQLRVPRRESDPDQAFSLRMGNGLFLGVINRTTYWIVAYVHRKGTYAALKADGGARLRREIAAEVPFLADRVDDLDLDEAGYLEVRINRLRRWHLPGLLLIGDAAHAMSPIGGVGINLAVQDAVAAANLLAAPLMRAQATGAVVSNDALAAIRRRRYLPAVVTQGFQRLIQRVGIERAFAGAAPPSRPALRRLGQLGPFRTVLSRIVGVGVLPEHVRSPLTTRSDSG